MDNISWKSWAFKACVHIRFQPDREAVQEELLAHLEDKAEAILREKGYESIEWVQTGCVIAAHSGPGAFGIVGFTNRP